MFWEPTDPCMSFHGPLWCVALLLICLVCTRQTWQVIISWSHRIHVRRKCFHQLFLACTCWFLVSALMMFTSVTYNSICLSKVLLITYFDKGHFYSQVSYNSCFYSNVIYPWHLLQPKVLANYYYYFKLLPFYLICSWLN